MKRTKVNIEVEMWGFEVDERYFTFRYLVRKDGRLVDKGEINDDYENGNTPSQQEEDLREEYGVCLVMQRVFA